MGNGVKLGFSTVTKTIQDNQNVRFACLAHDSNLSATSRLVEFPVCAGILPENRAQSMSLEVQRWWCFAGFGYTLLLFLVLACFSAGNLLNFWEV